MSGRCQRAQCRVVATAGSWAAAAGDAASCTVQLCAHYHVVDDVSLTTHLLAQLVRHVRNDVRQHTRQQQHNVLQRTTLQTTTSLPQCTGLWPLYTTICVSRHPQLSFTGHMPLLTASGVSVLERKRQRSPQRCYLLPVPLAHLWQCTAVNYDFSQVAQLLYS